jgi:uracil-DNA glycosylase
MKSIDRELDAHRTALLGCRRCGHEAGINPIVSLARSPRVMLVGQAPGKTEATGGQPFAGRAGRTLFSWLAMAGIDEAAARSRIYIAAITRCYPGPSPSGRGDRVPSPAERERCADWLGAEIRLIQPRLLIPVGRLAIDALVGALPLADVIGREVELASAATWALRRSPVVVPLPHPSGASSWVHAPGNRRLLEAALRLISRRWTDLEAGRRAA